MLRARKESLPKTAEGSGSAHPSSRARPQELQAGGRIGTVQLQLPVARPAGRPSEIRYSRTDIFRSLYKSLPIAGIDGTLKFRMKKTAAAGNVHAKTGSFTAINALAGYLKRKNGNQVAFAIMNQNVFPAAKARAFQDKVCEVLVAE